MNILLIFFAIPIAVIIFSIILQKLFRCPIIVASIVFAVFLVVTFAVGDLNLLVATIAYTLLALVTAYIVMLICRITHNHCFCRQNSIGLVNNSGTSLSNLTNFSNISNANSLNCNNLDTTFETVETGNLNNIGVNGTTCTCEQIDSNTISVTANISPISGSNGRCGRFYGTYRR